MTILSIIKKVLNDNFIYHKVSKSKKETKSPIVILT